MFIRTLVKGFCGVAAFLVVPALLMGSPNQRQTDPPAVAYQTLQVHNEASTLLQELRTKAIHVRDLADRLEMFNRDGSTISWQADAAVLTEAKSQVNAMDQMLLRLRTIRGEALPWQQKAIDRVAPKVVELTDYVQDAILNLNNNQPTIHLLDQTYAQDAEDMYQRANTIALSIGQFEEYATAKSEIQQLGPKLGIKTVS